MASDKTFEPKIVGFLCNWCSYAGADLAGTSRTRYPQNLRIIRVPCSGRVDPLFVLKAFQDGADGLLIGAGQFGRVRLSPEAADYFQEKNCPVEIRTTPDAVKFWNESQGSIIALFHITC